MSENEQSQIVRYVNTFTVADWQARRPNERIKKGITRVTKSNSQSADKFAQMIKQRQIQNQQVNDQNHNYTNRNRMKNNDPTSPQYLLQRIKMLELQLTVLEKEKIELERRVNNEEKKPMQNFVQSHYIACKQDLQEMIDEKKRLQEAIHNMGAQNNFLKLNLSIQEQYIIKVQSELDQLRITQVPYLTKNQVNQQFIQTEAIPKQIYQKSISQYIDAYTQSENYENNEYEEFTNLARKFQQQTTQFSALIQRLEQENATLTQQNVKLNNDLNTLCALYKQSQQINQKQVKQQQENIAVLKNQYKAKTQHENSKIQQENRIKLEELQSMIRSYQNIISSKDNEIEMMAKQKNKSPFMNKQDIQLKKDFMELQRCYKMATEDLRQAQKKHELINYQLLQKEQQIQMLKHRAIQQQRFQSRLNDEQTRNRQYQHEIMMLNTQLQNLRRQYQQKNANLSVEYVTFKKQFDDLLIYLEQKNQILRQKQLKIGQQMQTQQILFMKNEETLRKQTQIQAIISHYENQIKRIQGSLQNYITQLLAHKREEKQMQIKEMKAKQEKQQASNHQEKLYLLAKIDSLQQEISTLKTESKQYSKAYIFENAKIEEKQCIIAKLRADIVALSNKYQSQVALKSKITQQNYHNLQKIAEEESLMAQIRNELENIKSHYNNQISSMQRNIDKLESEQQSLQLKSINAQKAFESRLVQVKKDYDILYSKYMKYKTLSIHLQGCKPKIY